MEIFQDLELFQDMEMILDMDMILDVEAKHHEQPHRTTIDIQNKYIVKYIIYELNMGVNIDYSM